MRNGRCAWMLASVMILLLCSGVLPEGATRATGSQPAGRSREVIFAAQSHHRLHVFDAGTLEPLGEIAGLNERLEHVSVSPDGRTLYLAQAATFDGNGCCALFEFNLLTGEMCHLIEPALDSLPSPDGRSVFTQRGSVGIDAFDTTTLARTTIATFDIRRAHENRDRLPLRGHYALYPSTDGRWMFGITLWQKPALGIFDLRTKTMVRELAIPVASGAWLDDQFYLYENNDEGPRLVPINPDMTGFGPPRPITDASSPGQTRAQLPARAQLLAAGDRLLAYQPAATWMHNSGDTVRSGIFVIDPANGALTAHLAPSVEFAQLIVGAEGQRLYGLDAGGRARDRQDQPSPRLMALDARTGSVGAERALTPDVWHLAIASVPASVLPLGDLHPTACRTAR
jgi:hypothetical protein